MDAAADRRPAASGRAAVSEASARFFKGFRSEEAEVILETYFEREEEGGLQGDDVTNFLSAEEARELARQLIAAAEQVEARRKEQA
jgi:hypothetical protein